MLLSAFFALPGRAQTVFLANYEAGYDAAYAAGSTQALFGIKMPKEGARLTDGKFGRGLFLDKNVSAFLFGYETRSNYFHEQGTLEFWFRPEWDYAFKRPDDPAWNKPYPPSSCFTLFSTLESPYGYRLQKNQYNDLSFIYTYNYKYIAAVGTVCPEPLRWKKGEWVHFAMAWDRNDGRLFVNGRLIACSADWEVITPWEYRMYLSGWGTFDDVRVSSNKAYISSFAVPDAPLDVRKAAPPPPAPVITPEEKQALEKERVVFLVDFKDALTARMARGLPYGLVNRPPEFNGEGADKALRLRRSGVAPEATLCYSSRGHINPFLAIAELVVRPSPGAGYPMILLDASDLDRMGANALRKGLRLILKDALTLELQSLSRGRVIAAVSAPVALRPDGWNRIGVSWRSSVVTLLLDGRELKKEIGVPLPDRLPAYFFVGSDSQATTNCFDGWVRSVTILMK